MSYSVRRKIRRVVDGDTVELWSGLGRSRFVRLSGYDAPELNQFGGPRAKNILRGMIGNRFVTVVPEARDTYGRTVATIFHNRRNVNRRMSNLV